MDEDKVERISGDRPIKQKTFSATSTNFVEQQWRPRLSYRPAFMSIVRPIVCVSSPAFEVRPNLTLLQALNKQRQQRRRVSTGYRFLLSAIGFTPGFWASLWCRFR